MLGARPTCARTPNAPPRTTFLNFDTVGGDVPLTYILHEGSVPREGECPARRDARADRGQPAGARPAAGACDAGPADRRAPALAHGYEAITLLAQGDYDPALPPADATHTRTSHPPTVERTLEVGRELLARLDAEPTEAGAGRRSVTRLRVGPGAGLLGPGDRAAAPRAALARRGCRASLRRGGAGQVRRGDVAPARDSRAMRQLRRAGCSVSCRAAARRGAFRSVAASGPDSS